MGCPRRGEGGAGGGAIDRPYASELGLSEPSVCVVVAVGATRDDTSASRFAPEAFDSKDSAPVWTG